MEVKVKKGRIWLKNNLEYKGKFLEICISNGANKESFLCIISKDGRFYIPKEIRTKLGIIDRVFIESINILKNKKRIKDIIKNNKIDILATIPDKTLSGFEILVLEKDDKYLCWYCTKGRPKEIVLSKYVPLSFSKLLGYFQAESGKLKLQKRRGREFNFTNKRFNIIKEFLELSSYLFDNSLWNARISYNKNIQIKNIEKIMNDLVNLGINKNNIKIKEDATVKEYTVRLWLANSILAETISNFNVLLKNSLIKNNNEVFSNYFSGCIAGDGTFFTHRDKKGSLHSRLYVFEEKEEYILKHKEILSRYGIFGKITKSPTKNMYILSIILNWQMLLKLLEYDLLNSAPHHKKKLLWTIINHKKYRSLKYLVFLKKCFTSKDINKLIIKDCAYKSHWLVDRKNEGLIDFLSRKNNCSFWKLTDEGKRIKNILSIVRFT